MSITGGSCVLWSSGSLTGPSEAGVSMVRINKPLLPPLQLPGAPKFHPLLGVRRDRAGYEERERGDGALGEGRQGLRVRGGVLPAGRDRPGLGPLRMET